MSNPSIITFPAKLALVLFIVNLVAESSLNVKSCAKSVSGLAFSPPVSTALIVLALEIKPISTADALPESTVNLVNAELTVKLPTDVSSDALPVFDKVNSLPLDSKAKVALCPLVEEVSTKSLAC